MGWSLGVDGVAVKPKTDDTRSFIMSRPQLQMSPPTTEGLQAKEDVNSAVPRTVQSRYTHQMRYSPAQLTSGINVFPTLTMLNLGLSCGRIKK